MTDYNASAEQILKKALKAGVTSAEVYINYGNSLEIEISKGKTQNLVRAGSKGAGLKVYINGSKAFVTSTDLSEEAVDLMVEKTVVFAKETTPEDFNVLPSNTFSGIEDDLELMDRSLETIELEDKINLARLMEEHAFKYDKRITKTRAASYSESAFTTLIANTDGLNAEYSSTGCYLGISLTAEEKLYKQSSGYGVGKRFFSDLPDCRTIAEKAGEIALMIIGGEAVPTQKVPVVFDRNISSILLGAVAGGINGESIFRNQSFLQGMVGRRIAPESVTIIDDGRMVRGLRSRPFDGEGVPTNSKVVVDKGILKTYLYNTYTALKSGTETTGNAVRRSYASLPGISPFNFYMEKGGYSRNDIIGSVDNGLLVMEFVGGGPNVLTGDFSAGVAGVWIKNGKPAGPVGKITVAGKLSNMLMGIEMISDDLLFEGGTNCPTVKISQMTVSGT